MAKHGEATILIDRPLEAVFDYLADRENDATFSKRILEIAKVTDGPVEIVELERPRRIRWRELTRGPDCGGRRGVALRERDGRTELTFHGDLEGRGVGKLLPGPVSSRGRAGLPAYVAGIKRAVKAAV